MFALQIPSAEPGALPLSLSCAHLHQSRLTKNVRNIFQGSYREHPVRQITGKCNLWKCSEASHVELLNLFFFTQSNDWWDHHLDLWKL
jgi:hypothetical protein